MLQKDFISALKFVAPAMGVKDMRYYLNGVYLEFKEDNALSLTATDGHRLHTVTMEHDHGQPESVHIIDAASVKTVRGQAIELDISAPCEVPILHGIPAQIIEGTYPPYRRVIPSGDPQPTESIFFNTEYLSASAKAIKCLGRPVCKIDLFGDNNSIRITPSFSGFWSEVIAVIMPIDPTK
jgi:DNA polymerase III sliding clamp (beta) subunit (PCNA family)